MSASGRLWQYWRRSWRLQALRLLFLALLVSVTAVTSVSFFTDRVDRAMERQATQLLGGDLVLSSSRPISEQYQVWADEAGVTHAETIQFPSMASQGDAFQLSQIKAVSQAYPLQGEVRVSKDFAGAEQVVQQAPVAGEVWAEARLLQALGMQVGDTLTLGRQQFVASHVLTYEPSRSTNVFQFAPMLVMNLEDLEATGLLSPASRARFSQLFAGDARSIARLTAKIKPQLQATERIRTLEDGAPAVQQTLQRAGRFLGLAALLSVILAGAAIVLSSFVLVQHEARTVAVLKAQGMQRAAIMRLYASTLLITAGFAALVGIVLGFILQWSLAYWLANFIDQTLPAPSLAPVLSGMLTALLLLIGFALPVLWRLVQVPPIQVLKGSWQLNNATSGAWWKKYRLWLVTALPATTALLWLQAGDLTLALIMLVSLGLGILLFWGIAVLLLRLAIAWSYQPAGRWLAVLRRARRSSLLIVVFAVGLFSLLLLTAVRGDLLDRWQSSVPADAPNHFMINIQPAEKAPLEAYLTEQGLTAELYPMVRGRLTAINEQAIDVEQLQDRRAKRLAQREFNVSALAVLPESNDLLAGAWFSSANSNGFSIEEGIGETLGFGLGDKLTFDIAGQPFTDTVTSVREVRWDSMQPNFFVVTAADQLNDKPRTYITSLYVPPDQPDIIANLIKQFPSVTVIDIGSILNQVRDLIAQVTLAVQGIFVFTLITGLIVLMTVLQSQKAERRSELAVLKSLGATHKVLQGRLWTEFLSIGVLAGALAALLAMVVSNALGYVLFELPLTFNAGILGIGVIAGALLVGVGGFLVLRPLLNATPMRLLKG